MKFIYGGLAAAGIYAGYSYYNQSGAASPPASQENPPLAIDPKPKNSTFTGGDQGWLDLKLERIEEINHNTKKLRFSLPNKDDVSGLQVACEYIHLDLV